MYLKNTNNFNFLISAIHLFSKLIIFNLLDTFTDNKKMKLSGEYLTIPEIAEELDITYLTAKQRLLRAGIKPAAKDAIYPRSVLETIRDVPGKGRPKKTAQDKPASKSKKTK
jgi:hypothetical protein